MAAWTWSALGLVFASFSREAAASVGPLLHRRFVSASGSKLRYFLVVKLDSPSVSFREKLSALFLLLMRWSETVVGLKAKAESKLRPPFASGK